MSGWNFELRSRMGGASGAAYRSPLTGTGHTAEELISREALQNSSDALLEGESIVSVDFSIRNIVGAEKSKFLDATHMDEGYFAHADAQSFASVDAVKKFRDPEVPLRLMHINDWNTRGLGGPSHDDVEGADFFKFCFAIGDADKVGDEGTGGSYGYGKSVFAEASDISSVFIYSVFPPSEDTNGAHARLMGLSWFDKHRLDDQPYTGRGFLGVPDPEEEGLVHPFVDEEAHEAARALGFEVRTKEDTGLSILILGARLSAEQLRKSIETHWWPRLLENTLDVRLSMDGNKIDPPRPAKREDLVPFITCYRIATGIEEPVQPNQQQGRLQKIDGLEPGRWAAIALDDKDSQDQEEVGLQNCVVLMRAPRMVVEYLPVGRPYRIPIAGVFVADPAVDTPLKLSEPPAHDRWDPNSSRLTHDNGDDKKLVAQIINRIKGNIQRFQDSLLPKEETASDRIRELEKVLGGLFSQRHLASPPPPPPSEKRPVEIRIQESRLAAGDKEICSAIVRIKVRDEAGTDSDVARISGIFQVLAQDTQNVDENLETTISSYPPEGAIDADTNSVRISIDKNDWREIEFVSEKFDPDWFVRFSMSAEQAHA